MRVKLGLTCVSRKSDSYWVQPIDYKEHLESKDNLFEVSVLSVFEAEFDRLEIFKSFCKISRSQIFLRGHNLK